MANPDKIITSWPPRLVVCAGAVVLDGERALFVRQAQGHPLAGQFTIPWGLVEPDEPPHTAALRETHEEAGVEAEIIGLIGYQILHDPGWLALIFLCHHLSGIPHPDNIETDQAAYYSYNDLLTFPYPLEPWCDWLVKRVLQGDYRMIPMEPGNPYQPLQAFF